MCQFSGRSAADWQKQPPFVCMDNKGADKHVHPHVAAQTF